MIILTYLPRRKNKRRKHIRIPGSPERRFFFGGAGFWARPKNIHWTSVQVIYIYIFPRRRPGLRIFQYESVLPTHFGVQHTHQFCWCWCSEVTGCHGAIDFIAFWRGSYGSHGGYWEMHWCYISYKGEKKTRDTWRDVCSLSWKSKCFTFFGFIEWWLPQTPKIDPF